jgi:hypothetical protein
MNVEHHVAGLVAKDCIRMGGLVVEEFGAVVSVPLAWAVIREPKATNKILLMALA